MTLGPGGPCVALKKDKSSGNMMVCGKVQDHLWYAGPTCKGCYEKGQRSKKRNSEQMATGVPIDMEAVQEESQETLVEIEEIYAARCVARAFSNRGIKLSPLQPQPTRHTILPDCAVALTHSFDLTCRLSKIPRERRERRNALEENEKELEYNVYGKFEFELPSGKKAKAEWGRRWCTVMELAEVDGWADDVKTFEAELKAKGEEARAEFS